MKNGSVNIWNLNDYNIEKCVQIHQSWVTCLLVTNDFETMITLSESDDNKINVFNLKTFEIKLELFHHNQMFTSLKMLPNGNLISSSMDEQTLIVWNIDSGECLTIIKFDEYPSCFQFKLCPDSKVIFQISVTI